MDIPISELTADDLSFRGEGEEHIVLRIKNSLNVIRLRKVRVGSSVLIHEVIKLAQRDITFLSDVARPAFGALITDHAELVRLSPTTVKGIHENIKQHRQGLRLHKEINYHGIGCLCPDAALHFIIRTDDISEHQNGIYKNRSEKIFLERNSFISSGVNIMSCQNEEVRSCRKEISLAPSEDQSHFTKEISSDYISNSKTENLKVSIEQNSSYSNGDLLCIEIKPKAGTMDISVPDNPFCKFCIKNFLKVEKQKESSRSLYCPLDLFSGNKILMQKAIDGLFSTPQNNLNVFKNGEPVEDLLEFSYLRDVCINALLHDFSQSTNNSHSEELNLNSALGITLQCQKRDFLGSFKAHALYSKLIKTMGSQDVVDESLQSIDALELYGKKVWSFQNRYQTLLDKHKKYKTLNSELGTAYRAIKETKLCEKENSNEILNKRLKSQEHITSITSINNISSTNKNKKISRSNNKCIKKEIVFNSKKMEVEISQKINLKNEDKYSLEEINQEESSAVKYIPRLSELSINELGDNFSCEDMYFLLQENLFAMTAKDLSLMVLLRGPYPGISPKCEPWKSPFFINSSSGWYECQITAVDVIAKPASKIMKHKQDITRLCGILEQLRERKEEPMCCKILK